MKKLENKCGTTTGYKRHRTQKTPPCKECLDAVVAYKKLWKKEHPEEYKQRNREYYVKNVQKINERNKRFRIENPEKVKEYQDKYRVQNKDAREVYRQSNLEKFRHYARKRKAWKLNNGHEEYTEQQVLDRWGEDCHICFESIDFDASRKVGKNNWEKGFHIDHLIPLSKGGGDTLSNVRPAHALCNLQKNAKEFKEDLNGKL